MARNTNTNVAPGGGGGGMPSRGAKVSSSVKVTVKPGAAGLSSTEVARLKAINAMVSGMNTSQIQRALKAANKGIAAKTVSGRGGGMGGGLNINKVR
jgi:hypothetical protein